MAATVRAPRRRTDAAAKRPARVAAPEADRPEEVAALMDAMIEEHVARWRLLSAEIARNLAAVRR